MQANAAILLTAFLFGGSLLYSSAFAAFLFKTLPAVEAGRLLRSAFSAFYLWVFTTAAVCAVLCLGIDTVSFYVLAAVALITVPLRQWLMPAINAASDSDDSARFRHLHTLSVLAGLAQIAATAYALLRLS